MCLMAQDYKVGNISHVFEIQANQYFGDHFEYESGGAWGKTKNLIGLNNLYL